MKIRVLASLLMSWLVLQENCFVAAAASFALDPSFKPRITQAAGYINVALIQPDEKLIVTGDYQFVNGTRRIGLTRFNHDGSIDSTFVSAFDAGALILQSDGKIIVDGQWRLNFDGTLDNNYNVSSPGWAQTAVLAPDGKLFIGGGRVRNNTASPFVLRLNRDGTTDAEFQAILTDSSLQGRNAVGALAIQPDGKLLIGGDFDSVNGSSRKGIARVNADGSLDATFLAETNLTVGTLLLQADGKTIVLGTISNLDAGRFVNILRLNKDGTLDVGFDAHRAQAHLGLEFRNVAVALQPDGKLVLTSNLRFDDDSVFLRLNPDGSLDETFKVWKGVYRVFLGFRSDGKILTSVPGNLEWLSDNGELHARIPTIFEREGSVWSLTRQHDGKCVIMGQFESVDGQARSGFARLQRDGSLDDTFDPRGIGPTEDFSGWAPVLPKLIAHGDGKIIVLGSLRNPNGKPLAEITRFNPDGHVDTEFAPFPGAQGTHGILQPDGKLVIAGSLPNPIRLNPDGSLDPTFIATFNDERVLALALLTDGKFMVAGEEQLVRLNSDGSLDSSFNQPIGIQNLAHPAPIVAVAAQRDGRLIVAGYFGNVRGQDGASVARLLSDGSSDGSFDPGRIDFAATANTAVAETLLLPGAFFGDGVLSPRLIQLDSAGRLLQILQIPFALGGSGGNFAAAAYVTDDTVILGSIIHHGFQTRVNRPGMALVVAMPSLRAPHLTGQGFCSILLSGSLGHTYQVEFSTDMVQWFPLRTGMVTGISLEFEDNTASSSSYRFYRAWLAHP